MTMGRGLRLGMVLIAALGGAALAQTQTTGWLSPTVDDGEFAHGARAYRDDGLYATAAGGQEHIYWGFGIPLPVGVDIVGIEVLLDARRPPGPPASLHVELSWNGGLSWTTTGYGTETLHPVFWRQHVLGGGTDTWGRSWSGAEFSDGTFQVRLQADGPSQLNWVAVRVHYREGITQTLSVVPQLVDLGVLTLAHYDAGHKEISPAQRITVSSASAWSLYVAADDPTWTYMGSEPPPGKPCAHLQVRVSAFSSGVTGPQTTYTGLTTGQQRVAGGGASTGLWLDIALRVLVDYATTVPGSYELRYMFTLTSP